MILNRCLELSFDFKNLSSCFVFWRGARVGVNSPIKFIMKGKVLTLNKIDESTIRVVLFQTTSNKPM